MNHGRRISFWDEERNMTMKLKLVWAGMIFLLPLAAPALGNENMAGASSVAAAYLDAMEASDLDAAEALFTKNSLIFETGGVEGAWEQYRQHHLGPEMESVSSFSTERGEVRTFASQDGTMVTVTWPLEYRIVLTDETTIHSKATLTFVLISESDTYRIVHMHWSSRRVRSSH